MMSRKQRKEKCLFLFALTVYLCFIRACYAVSLGKRGDGLAGIKRDGDVPKGLWSFGEQLEGSTNVGQSDVLGPEPAAFGGAAGYFSVSILGESDLALNNLSWSVGERRPLRSSGPDSSHGYQADSTGFDGVQGQIQSSSFDSSPKLSQWLAMRPLVLCDHKAMTLTASGEGLAHLLVDRVGASPISLFQLPSYCGYSVKASWQEVEVMVPYDACYITQENGSYILSMLWLGSPLKLSCPMQIVAPVPSVFCSSPGMAVQMPGLEPNIQTLGVIVNGDWGPFVSEGCAHSVPSNPGFFVFFIPHSAPCLTTRDGLYLHFLIDDQEYILSCAATPQFPHVPDPVGPAPTTPPQPPTQKQITQIPEDPQYLYPGLQYPLLPQLYPPGPQPPRPPKPTLDSPPGPPSQQQQSPTLIGTPASLPSSPEDHQKEYISLLNQPAVMLQTPFPQKPDPAQEHSTNQINKLLVDRTHYLPWVHSPYGPFFYNTVTPAPAPEAGISMSVPPAVQPPQSPTSSYKSQHYQVLYYPAPAPAPVAKVTMPPPSVPPPFPSPPFSPPAQPADHYQVIPLYLPAPDSSYYQYGKVFYLNPGFELQPASTSHLTSPLSPHHTRTIVPKHPDSPNSPFDHFYPQKPIYFPQSTPPPPVQEEPHTVPEQPLRPVALPKTCLAYPHIICSYYLHPYYPLYPPHYPPQTHYPPAVHQFSPTQQPGTTKKPLTTMTAATPPTITFTPTGPSPQTPYVQCVMGSMDAFLPFADPESIEVRDKEGSWEFLSSVSPLCGYMLQTVEDYGVLLHSPLPACHSELQIQSTISLPLRFWDQSFGQYRTLDLECPHQTVPVTPEPVTPTVPLSPPSTTGGEVSPPIVTAPKVLCSSHQMNVELPPGPISEIVVKDIKGNQIKLQDAPKDCGYSARKGKNGKIHLNLQLHTHCHMSMQGKTYIITVVYMTQSERREAQFFCPVLIPESGQECNLPSNHRLPCGPDSVSQSQCLSMGCCFSKQPPTCYYPMDACTADRHFVFSVPASLTDPPLSPTLLLTSGNSTCKPQRATSQYALFKIPMDGCGTRRVMVGKTLIYMVEVVNKVQAISLNYGTITRDSPVRLLVECRYMPSSVQSVSYMVKTPSLGPAVQTQGVFGVQLRIAKDAQYKSYYPQYHQPLQMLLGKPLYLEVRLLNTPDPSLVLLVHFCVAYPRSGKAVWLILYNGCPNPLDPAPQQAILLNPRPPSPQGQTRRFTISTFQFLPDGQLKDPDEEIYFMCSTEICSPRDGPCVEGCFGQ